MIDTHLHLDLLKDYIASLENAKLAGVRKFITVGTDIESSKKGIDFSNRYEGVFASVGVHPHSADTFSARDVERLREFLTLKGVVAVGETGIDLYRNLSSKENQIGAFCAQIELAEEGGLPLIVHQREATREVRDVLKRVKPSVGVLMHCFSGDEEYAQFCEEEGYYISFAGNLTYKNAIKLQDIARSYPRKLIVLETDSPYLSPEPFRGQENGPKNLPTIAEKLAGLWGVGEDEVVGITEQNSERFFSLQC